MKHTKRLIPLILFLAIILIFVITGRKTNQYGLVDTLLSLPTSQSLWESGHVYLDPYLDRPVLPSGETLSDIKGGFRTIEAEGRTVDYFPAGPAILTLPLTAILNTAGYDLVDPGTNLAVQNRIAFLTASIALLLVFTLVCIWHPAWESLSITLIVFFGSVIFSTMGSAFWSINYTLIFNVTILILLSLKQTVLQDGQYRVAIGAAIGVLLFLSFFCRVSSFAIVFCMLSYLLLTDFKQAVISGAVALSCLALFGVWSLNEYGLILPPYYGLNRLNDAPAPMWVGLYGNLISPSRGLFVFMPWLVLPIGSIMFRPNLLKNSLVIFCLSWVLVQLVIASRAVVWWGGGSFGPRLLAEAMPGLILLTLIAWQEIKASSRYQIGVAALFIALGVFSIWVHSWQAFFNPFTAQLWYDNAPAIVGDPSDDLGPYFDWSFSQLLSNSETVCDLNQIHLTTRIIPFENSLERIALGELVQYTADRQLDFNERAMVEFLTGAKAQPVEPSNGNKALFQGMFIDRDGGKWSNCQTAVLYFRVDENLAANETLALKIDLASIENQAVEINLNGKNLKTINVQKAIQTFSVQINPADLDSQGINELQLNAQTLRKPTPEEDNVQFNGPVGIKLTQFSFQAP